jgi:hypothetical protein
MKNPNRNFKRAIDMTFVRNLEKRTGRVFTEVDFENEDEPVYVSKDGSFIVEEVPEFAFPRGVMSLAALASLPQILPNGETVGDSNLWDSYEAGEQAYRNESSSGASEEESDWASSRGYSKEEKKEFGIKG